MGSPDFDDKFVRFFMQHVVALNVACDLADGKRVRDVFTSFVLEIWGQWLLVTAGHSLAKLYTILPERKNVETSLFDAWHGGAHPLPVPFPLLDERHFALDKGGLDLGLVHLAPFYRHQLEANGIKAFDESTWRRPPPDILGHALLGLPDQFTEQLTTTGGFPALSVRPTLIPVRRIDPPPEMATKFPRFYGQLSRRLVNEHTGASLDDMQGLSGGPIVGFKPYPDGQVRYFLVAVQSGWRRDLRVVAGPLMPAIADWIGEELEAATKPA